MEPMILMRDVSKHFGATKALDGLTFSVTPGEVFGFLGPSGAGKTTTIKLLTRQLRADGGEAALFGQPIETLPQSAFDEIGVLSDTSGYYERLTVQENLEVFAGLKGLSAKAIDEVLAEVELSDARKKPARQLSRGMAQRLMLACAVLHRPRLLFLDEPTAALDPGTSAQIHALLRRMNAEGTTIFLTTHNMEEADKLCSRVAFLNQGRIVACDTPKALKLSHAGDGMTALTASGAEISVPKDASGLRALADRLEESGETLLTLHSQEPSLEDVFLTLTGRTLA